MKEVKFVIMIDEGNARSGYADWDEEGYSVPVFFDTYEEAHAHMKELATEYKNSDEILFVDVAIVGGGDVILTRNGKCTCTLKKGESLYD